MAARKSLGPLRNISQPARSRNLCQHPRHLDRHVGCTGTSVIPSMYQRKIKRGVPVDFLLYPLPSIMSKPVRPPKRSQKHRRIVGVSVNKRSRSIAPRAHGAWGSTLTLIKPTQFVFPINDMPRDFWTHMARQGYLEIDDWMRFASVCKRAYEIVWEKLPWRALFQEPRLARFLEHNQWRFVSNGLLYQVFHCHCLCQETIVSDRQQLRAFLNAIQTHICGQCGLKSMIDGLDPVFGEEFVLDIWCRTMGLVGKRCFECFHNSFPTALWRSPSWYDDYTARIVEPMLVTLDIAKRFPKRKSVRASLSHHDMRRNDYRLERDEVEFYTQLFLWRLEQLGYDKALQRLYPTAHRLAKLYLFNHLKHYNNGPPPGVEHWDRFIEASILYSAMPELIQSSSSLTSTM